MIALHLFWNKMKTPNLKPVFFKCPVIILNAFCHSYKKSSHQNVCLPLQTKVEFTSNKTKLFVSFFSLDHCIIEHQEVISATSSHAHTIHQPKSTPNMFPPCLWVSKSK